MTYNPNHSNSTKTISHGNFVYSVNIDTDSLVRKNGRIDWINSIGIQVEHQVLGTITLLGKEGGRVYFKFERTGTVSSTNSANLTNGIISDCQQPTLSGVGIIGFAEGPFNHTNRPYKLWANMIQRCYKENFTSYKSYGAKGVTVCERWKRFEYFEQDIKLLDGYEGWLNSDYEIDKDGNAIEGQPKQYSPETCQFIPKADNLAIRHNK